MGHPFSHFEAKSLLKRVATFFDPGTAFISANRNFLFVCGGRMDKEYMRPLFRDFAKERLPNWHIFLAEKTWGALVSNDGAQLHDLAIIEELIGQIADAIILFPESPGSYAELGYFSKTPKLAKKFLVVSDDAHVGQDSFIALVPIRLIDRTSIYNPAIPLIYGKNTDFSRIVKRLDTRTNRKRKSLKREKRALNDREYFFLVLELIRIFRVVTIDGIGYVVKSIFGHSRPSTIKNVVAILESAGFVSRCGLDNEFVYVTSGTSTFVEFEGIDEIDFKFKLLDFYRTCAADIFDLVSELPK